MPSDKNPGHICYAMDKYLILWDLKDRDRCNETYRTEEEQLKKLNKRLEAYENVGDKFVPAEYLFDYCYRRFNTTQHRQNEDLMLCLYFENARSAQKEWKIIVEDRCLNRIFSTNTTIFQYNLFYKYQCLMLLDKKFRDGKISIENLPHLKYQINQCLNETLPISIRQYCLQVLESKYKLDRGLYHIKYNESEDFEIIERRPWVNPTLIEEYLC